MRLRKLELQGYKTFAAKCEFFFDDGITAIVGPNGSGKSNIADGVRWVLGEQSYRLLRAKSTEDMIFSGSAQRPRAGLAQVTITLDNHDRWLPVEFSEVTISRRAYRSGDNEYFINGNRVRLRDVQELLGRSGLARRTYTVIGQGLIDAALALRPEERRQLFEEAAGITIHQTKRGEALAKLEATQANLVRLNDILAEISPRLRALQVQAEKAERYMEIADQLQAVLRTWYGYRWHALQISIGQANQTLQRYQEVVERHQYNIHTIEEQLAAQRAEQNTLREALSNLHRDSSMLHAGADAIERDLAVWQERLTQLSRQLSDLGSELTELQTTLQVHGERLANSENELHIIDSQKAEQTAHLKQAEQQAQAREAERHQLAGALAKTRDDAFRIATSLADCRNRLLQIDERERELAAERQQHQAKVSECQKEIGIFERQIRTLLRELDAWQEATALLETEQRKAIAQASEVAAIRPSLEEELEQARADLARLRARRDLLSRLREDMEGYYAGVRSTMRAGIAGVIGPVASHITVPPQLERAIETALGNHLQDILVERWETAEQAIEYLKQTRGGRATFLPLDTVRASELRRFPNGEGIIGLASDLIEYEAHLKPAIHMLLGHTVVVENLSVARRVMKEMHGSFQIVTPAGEIVRSSGAVTGGMNRGDSDNTGMLAREREWRDLPALQQKAEKRVEAATAALEENRRAEAGHRQRAEDIAHQLQQRHSRQEELSRQIQEVRRQQDRSAQESEWHRRLIDQVTKEMGALADKRAELKKQLEDLTEKQTYVEAKAAKLQKQLAGLSIEDVQNRISELRSALAVLDSRRESQLTIIRSQRASWQATQDQISAKTRRAKELERERENLSEKIKIATEERERLHSQLQAIDQQIAPAENKLSELEISISKLVSLQDQLRQKLREAESQLAQATLEVERQEERLRSLRRQIEEELGLVQLEPVAGVAEQPPLPLPSLVSELPVVQELPDGIEDEVNRLRAQLRRLGTVNPQAPEEYADTLQRYTFLTEQIEDLEKASRSLRGVIAELDEIMERDFMQTFRAVNAQFRQYFTMLFGGGTAQLTLTDPDRPTETGIDIIARPPGKRQQGLALLSGGERALTAAALIFAILKVSPTPFCFLDEVDAALDEANIGRFRDALKSLTPQIQFIVITHNRGTIEAADTIYGITMGEDGTSRSVSLKLDNVEIEPATAA